MKSVWFFTPQPLRCAGIVFPMMSRREFGQASGWQEKAYPGCITETLRCRKLVIDRDIGWGVGVQCHGVNMI